MDVKSEHSISWSVQPHKKSINFGIFRHPGSGIAPTPRLPSASYEAPPTPTSKTAEVSADSATAQSTSSAAVEKLKGIGLRLVYWHGNCEANLVTTGKYDVPKHEGGMYALVFDNTFAKQFSKTATFVLLTHPSHIVPQSNHQAIHHIQGSGAGSAQSLRINPTRSRPKLKAERRSSDSLSAHGLTSARSTSANQGSESKEYSASIASSSFYTGVLQKRRRKRHQGYARRFFFLDFSTATLSYYHDRHTLAIRGAVPLSLAAIAANSSTREISIDSGAEVWHLKAINKRDFEAWREALESASNTYSNESSTAGSRIDLLRRSMSNFRMSPEDERDWAKVERLVSRIGASREIARNLAKDTDLKYLSMPTLQPPSAVSSSTDTSQAMSSAEPSPSEPSNNEDYFGNERRHFWHRKPSSGHASPFRRSASAQGASQKVNGMQTYTKHNPPGGPKLQDLTMEPVHERCMELLYNLNSIVADFSQLLAESKQRRTPLPSHAASRMSIDSVGTQEFFDAEAGEGSQLLTIQHGSDDEGVATEHESAGDEHDASSASELEDGDGLTQSATLDIKKRSLFPIKPKALNLRQSEPVARRARISPPTMSPPSLIGFLRKNVGKDLSTISMPVSANEPISLLQKAAEQLEYSQLLDGAASNSTSGMERLLNVTAFAISLLSEFRVKERAIRKPFNPMLGETFELIREDKGFRFVGEKVSHRPVRLTWQADSERWSLSQSPLPTQKFWGKSAELTTEGKVRLSLHDLGEQYSWVPATCFLKNIIAGEKYVEPFGTMKIFNETTGAHASVTFKAKGMFSGRSDEVVVQTFDASGDEIPLGLAGTWTQSLTLVEHGIPRPSPIWQAGELVPDAPKCYGFTTFAASLNELLPGEKAAIAPTDSRLRPDQRAVENGDFDRAEALKAQLEEAQRERRRVMDEEGAEWQPAWFSKVDGVEGEEVWKMKSGKEGYWEARAKGIWKEVRQVFTV